MSPPRSMRSGRRTVNCTRRPSARASSAPIARSTISSSSRATPPSMAAAAEAPWWTGSAMSLPSVFPELPLRPRSWAQASTSSFRSPMRSSSSPLKLVEQDRGIAANEAIGPGMELERTNSMTAMGRMAALHVAFWQYDPWYRRAWFVWPQVTAILARELASCGSSSGSGPGGQLGKARRLQQRVDAGLRSNPARRVFLGR